jgi:adenylate cyclase
MMAEKGSFDRKARSGLPSRKMISATGFAITIGLPLLFFLMPTFLQYFDGKLYDVFLSRTPPVAHSDRILIVDIDDDSLREHGQWPWPRYKIARMLDRLAEAGAAAIGIDIMFPEKDRTSPANYRADLLRDLDLGIDITAAHLLPDHDQLLAEAISTSPSVLGYQFLFEPTAAPFHGPLHPLQLTGPGPSPLADRFGWRATDAICSLSLLNEKARTSGFFNMAPDADGILRSIPMVIAYQDRLHPGLALATVMQALRIERVGLRRDLDGYTLGIGGTQVPLDARGAMLVRFRGKGKTYPYVSAADLLAGRVAGSRIADKIIFVGTTASGLKEFRSTPTDPIFPGVEVHATIADNLLGADFLSRPASAPAIEWFAALLCGTLYVVAIGRTRALGSLVLYGVGAFGLVFLSLRLFDAKGVYLSPALPLLVLTANFAFLNLLHFRREEQKSKQHVYDLASAQGAIIETMAALTETRDRETGGHIKRTQAYVRLLADALRKQPAYRSVLTHEVVELIYRSAPLHDIGKVGISDRILLKPGALSEEEFEEIKKHATIGKDVIEGIQRRIGTPPFIRMAHDITYTHHEKWDGSGYPQGLKAEQIPFAGRLMAIADMYDALTSRRAYKAPIAHEEAVRIMTDCAPGSFDPQIFSTFLSIAEQFKEVSERTDDGV